MGDDLAKSPHMANIGGSVYHDVPREGYWVDRDDNPSPLMKQSLLYKLHTYKIHKNSNPAIEKCVPCGWAVACVCGVCVWRVCVACVLAGLLCDVMACLRYFEHVHDSPNKMVRVFK